MTLFQKVSAKGIKPLVIIGENGHCAKPFSAYPKDAQWCYVDYLEANACVKIICHAPEPLFNARLMNPVIICRHQGKRNSLME